MPEERGRERKHRKEPEEHRRARRIDEQQPGQDADAGGLGISTQSTLPFVPDMLPTDQRLTGRGNSAVRIILIQRMQEDFGNHAVQRLMQRARATAMPDGDQRGSGGEEPATGDGEASGTEEKEIVKDKAGIAPGSEAALRRASKRVR